MQVLDHAMQMEKDGEAFYRDLAGRCTGAGLATILTKLADAEVAHYEILQQIKDSRAAALADCTLREDAKNVFQQMIEEGQTFDLNTGELDLYKKALEIEQKSRDFYLSKANDVDSPAAKEIFFKIADEEKLHCSLIESIIEFVSKPIAGNWLENAEWFHLDEY